MHKIHSINRIEGFRQLSARETQLIVLASEGMTDKEIARFLGISNGTVVTMWSRMRAKLGISSRVSAVAVVVSAVSRLCERIAHTRGAEEWNSYRILLNGKAIVLSCDQNAIVRLGIRPGDSATDRVQRLFLRSDGAQIQDADLPWIAALGGNTASRTAVGRAGQEYSVTCIPVEDATLGKTLLVEFTLMAGGGHKAVADPLHFRLATAN